METEATTTSTRSSSARYHGWTMLGRYGEYGDESSPFPAADDRTAAASFNSDGHLIHVSMGVAAPPTASCLYAQSPEEGRISDWLRVITAHGDSVLIQIETSTNLGRSRRWSDYQKDHFVYSAGDGASRPPSLRLLPRCNFFLRRRKSLCTEENRGFFIEDPSGTNMETTRRLDLDATGFLRRGKNAFVVAELQMLATELRKPAAELLVVRSGGKWTVKRTPISSPIDKCREISSWNTHAVVPVGNRMLCWVDLHRGVMFCDMFDDRPELRYVSLPVKVNALGYPKMSRNVCTTTSGSVKFVDTLGTHKCPRSCYVDAVRTWTLRMEDMVWVKDGMLDVAQLWAQDLWKGLPRVNLDYPVVCIDDPNLICFLVSEQHKTHQWLVMVDMTSGTVQSVSRCPELLGRRYEYREKETCIPSKFSSYLSSQK